MLSDRQTGPKRQRVLWAYDREHLIRPVMRLAIDSLVASGCAVHVVCADAAPDASYATYDSFSFAARRRNWARAAYGLCDGLKGRAVAALKAAEPIRVELRRALLQRRFVKARWLRARCRYLERKSVAFSLTRKAVRRMAKLQADTVDLWLPYARGYTRMLTINADVVIASRPEVALWAWALARLRGARFVYYPFELYGRKAFPQSRFGRFSERLVLAHCADAVITQNEARADVLMRELGARVRPVIVHNYKSGRRAASGGRLREVLALPGTTRVALYEGVLVPGRSLDLLAQAAALLPRDGVTVLMGPKRLGWPDQRALAALSKPLAEGRLVILPPVPQDILLDYVADADVGVIIYDGAVQNNYLCEPGKLSDYVAAGVPVVAPGFPTIAPVVEQYGIGICFATTTPEAIAAAIGGVLDRGKSSWQVDLSRAAAALTWSSQVPALFSALGIGQEKSRPQAATMRPARARTRGGFART